MEGRPAASGPPAGGTAPLAGITTQFGRIQVSGLQHHRELVGRAPSLGILLAGGQHLPLQAPGLAPYVEGDHMDHKLLRDLGHALAMGRSHPLADISLDGLAVMTH